MEAVIFCGIQASGKTTFYARTFLETHVRISRDLLRTPHREAVLLRACLETRMAFVVDKLNATAEDRRPYVEAARDAGFRVAGYWFDARSAEAIPRNAAREPKARVPERGIYGTHKRLRPPRFEEGFDALYRVVIDPATGFAVSPVPG